MRSKYISPTSSEESPFVGVAIDYAHNLLTGTFIRNMGTKKSSLHVEDDDLGAIFVETFGSVYPNSANEFTSLTPKQQGIWLRKYLKAKGKAAVEPRAVGEPINANINTVCSLSGLSDVQKKILTFLLAINDLPSLKELVHVFDFVTTSHAIQLISIAINSPHKEVSDALSPTARLVSCGLVSIDSGSNHLDDKIDTMSGITDIMSVPNLTQESLLSHFLPAAAPTNLEWSDFSHMEAQVSFAKSILECGMEKKQRGINIIFYGETGTGKTELAKLLAKETGTLLYNVGTEDQEGGDPDASDRIASLLVGQWLVSNGKSILLFDELEDLFSWGSFDFGAFGRADVKFSKQWFNNVLENSLVPTIWITNNVRGIDPAFLRRFTYAIEFKPLDSKQRAKVINRYLLDSVLTEAQVNGLAEKYNASPAQINNAIAVARLISPNGQPDIKAIEQVLGATERSISLTARGHVEKAAPKVTFNVSSYCLDALNASDNLLQIAEKINGWKPSHEPGISMCLYGPPGTGKSEYVKYVAHKMQKNVLVKRASDILNLYLGESEKAIARAFAEAEETGSILLFDEVDSFLQDRNKATKSWEVTQVNEFLQQMEIFRGFVVCTTNLYEGLDAASLRRFIFKIKFDFLKPEQAVMLFKTILPDILNNCGLLSVEEEELIAAEAKGIYGLAPGDFAAIRRRERALGRFHEVVDVIKMLKEEVKAKHLIKPNNIGFGS